MLSAAAVRSDTSGTWDENLYLDMSYFAVARHTWAPAVRFGTGPVPLLVAYGPVLLGREKPPTEPTERESLIQGARASSALVFGSALVLLVFAWLARRHGAAWGLLGAAFVAFSPGVLGHVSLATTDAATAAAMVGWLHVASRTRRVPGTASLVGLALATGLAFATKHSTWPLGLVGLLLVDIPKTKRQPPKTPNTPSLAWPKPFGVFGVFGGSRSRLHDDRSPLSARSVGRAAAFALLAFLAAWACYGFEVVGRLPAPIASVVTRIGQARDLEFAYFFHGARYSGSWCGWALLAAFALKSTAAELGVALVLPAALARARRRLDGDDALVAAVLVLYTLFLVTSRAATTYRLLVPVQVLLVLLAFSAAARLGSKKLRWAVLAVAIQIGAWAHAAPRFLSSFNGIACTSREAYRWLADSNLDWGQDLPALARTLDARGSRRCLVSYFGNTWPQAYGIRYESLRSPDAAAVASCDWVAISATDLDAVNDPSDRCAAFRALEPDERAGDSILLYDARRPEVRSAIEAARR